MLRMEKLRALAYELTLSKEDMTLEIDSGQRLLQLQT